MVLRLDSEPAAAPVAWEWERRRERGVGRRGRGARALFDGSPRHGLTAMAERRARSGVAPGGAGERTPVTDGVSNGRRVEVAWWLDSNSGSGVQRLCARWRETWKPVWRWARCGWCQQLSSGQSKLGAGAVGASSALRHAEEKGKSTRAPGERKEGGRGRGKKGRRERTWGAVATRDWSSPCARWRGVGQCASREKAEERESEGEVIVGWDRPDGGTRWQREKEDGAAAGGQPRGGAQLAGMEREKGQLPCGAAGFK
jgi:hypothetical protein